MTKCKRRKTVTTNIYHTHSYTETVTAPTCTTGGYTTYTCACGDSYQGNVVAATGHDGSFLAAEAATCTEDGYEDYYCSTCGEMYTVILPATGHTLTDGGLIPWCTVCNYNRPGDPNFWSLRSGAILEKTVVTTYSYVYNGGSLSQMTVTTATTEDGTTTTTTDTLYFAYDAAGTPQTVTHNGTTYYYALNLQGDVVSILNASGTAVVSYTYDAWGKLLTTTGSMASTLGTHNPLRYRGYVYETETEYYYLQSRYYTPETGRFLNADAATSTGQGFVGNNMFVYCLNNPVNGCDPCGTCFHRLDFWNDCEKCGGKTIGDKWNDVTAWCADTYNTINEAHIRQIEVESQITMKQLQLTRHAAQTMWELHVHNVEMELKNQAQRDMTIIETGEYLADNPLIAVDLATGVVGTGTTYIGLAAAISGTTIPVVGQIIMGVAGAVCGIWGIGRVVATIFEKLS